MLRDKKIVVGVGIILATSLLPVIYQFSALEGEAEKERFIINLTTSESEVVSNLYSQGFIRSPLAFNLVLTFRFWHGKIEPGGYMIAKSMSAFNLADVLVNHPYQKWVVLPEGLRKEEIAEIAQEKLGWSKAKKDDFLTEAREGYLFPDTYLLNLDYSGKEVAKRMTNNFNEKVADLFLKASENNIRNDTLIVLASLVQRETASETEMPLIAGIVWNRWLKSMHFEIDATVQYALGEPGNWWPSITSKDYKVDSPYNTYLHKGRPPAPICNPGLAALASVIFPEETNYLYYLHDKDKQIHCALTYKEHLENIDKYLILPKVELCVKSYLDANKKKLSLNAFEILEILRLKDDPKGDFAAEVKLSHNGKVLKDFASEMMRIYVVEENGEYKISYDTGASVR